jgi:precorrin-2 dehydrogenase / sirohydrochlorin ferrochelatase
MARTWTCENGSEQRLKLYRRPPVVITLEVVGYLPIFLDLESRPCIVIGGRESAEARVRALLDAGAIVTVVSGEAAIGIQSLAAAGKLRLIERDYEYGDFRGCSLAYLSATEAENFQCAVREARELGVLLNVADQPKISTFISPAIVKRGDLQIAISTSGSSPSVARILRRRLEQQIHPGYARVLEIMRCARQFLRLREPDAGARSRIMNSLAEALVQSVERLDDALIDQALRLHLCAGIAEIGLDAQNRANTG